MCVVCLCVCEDLGVCTCAHVHAIEHGQRSEDCFWYGYSPPSTMWGPRVRLRWSAGYQLNRLQGLYAVPFCDCNSFMK